MASGIYLCAKIWVSLFSSIIFLGGIALIVLDLLFFNFDEILPTRDFAKAGTVVIWILFSLGVLGIIFGVIGLLGALKESKVIIGVYIAGMVVFVLVI